MSDLIQTARNLARNTGWPVFPCASNKAPAIPKSEGGRGFLGASTDPDEIARMFSHRNAALIGIPTGPASGLDVLDIDIKHDAARAWLAMAEAMIPPTRTYHTMSGGVHLYFRHADAVANSQSKLARGVDTRGTGGYIVFWFAAGLECLDHTPPAPWPAWLLTTLLRAPEPAPLPAPGRRYKGNGARPQAMVRRAMDRVAGAAEGPDGTEAPAVGAAGRIDSTLVKALARAFRWRRMLESGVVSTVGEIAVREKINKSYVSRVLRLTLLAPQIVEAILDGRQAEGMTLRGLMGPFPVEWDQQSRSIGEFRSTVGAVGPNRSNSQ